MSIAGRVGGALLVLLHVLARLLLAVVVLVAIGAGALAWRLSQGPIALPWLAHRLEAAANAGKRPVHLAIGRAALAWEGFSQGVGVPLDLRLARVVATDAAGVPIARVPNAELAVAVAPLLLGRIAPTGLAVDGARLTLTRDANGVIAFGGPGEVLPGLAGPQKTAASGRLHLDLWRRVLIRDATLTVLDRQIGATWSAEHVAIELGRAAAGGVTGRANATLALGETSTRLAAQAAVTPRGSIVTARLSPVTPAALARAAPGLGAFAALDAPVSGSTTFDLDRSLGLRHFRLALQAGAGQAQIAQGRVPLVAAELVVEGTPRAATLRQLQATLAAPSGARGPIVHASGTLTRAAGRMTAKLALGFDRVPFTDLARYWPAGVGGGARPWLTENVTAGTATGAQVALTLASAADLSDLALVAASGTIQGSGLTVHWLRPLPPITQGVATVTIVSPDEIDIAARSGRDGALVLGQGTVRVTKLEAKDQIGSIALDVIGPLASAIALLSQPRLRLLSRHKLPLHDPAGQQATHLTVRLPMRNKLTIDQIAIRADAKLTEVHLARLVTGRDLDGGTLALQASNDGLSVSGRAMLAGIASRLSVAMDFRDGPGTQVLTRAEVSGTTTPAQLRAAGIDTGGVLRGGSAALRVGYAEQRDGTADVELHADLTQAAIAAPLVAWSKREGAPAEASARILLDGGRVTGIDALHATGPGLLVDGSSRFADGRPSVLRLDRAVIGRSDAAGEIRFPASPGQPIAIALHGPTLDLSSALPQHATPTQARTPTAKGPPWTLDARFARVALTRNAGFSAVTLSAASDGNLVREATLTSGAPEQVRGRIVPDRAGGRSLSLTAADAGALLRDLDITDNMRGGTLALTARFDDRAPRHPLSGTAQIVNTRVADAPAVAKVLQGMTLYGLVAALRGPGMTVSRAIAPFRLDGPVLTIADARAYNPSLGVTIKGSVDLNRRVADLQGTIVPAYMLNSFLGGIPVIGRLFSPERGGGIFAATYSVRGTLRDPAVTVNPLAALTPGFLRGLFGIFGK